MRASRLAEGSQDIGGLLTRCETIASDSVQAIAQMADAAGDPGLASALGGAAEAGAKAFLNAGAAYQHVAGSLTATARNYAQAEQDLAARSGAIIRRPA